MAEEAAAATVDPEVDGRLDRASDRKRRELRDALTKTLEAGEPADKKTRKQQFDAMIQVLSTSALLGSEGAAARAASLLLAEVRKAKSGKGGTVLQVSDSVSYLPPEVGEAVLLAVGVDPVEARRIATSAHRRVVAESESPPIAE